MSNTFCAFWRSRLPVGSSASRQAGSVTRALAFAAGEFARAVAHALFEAGFFQHGQCLIAGLGFGDFADQERHHHVFQRGKFGQQVVELVNEAEVAVAQRAEGFLAHLREVAAEQGDAAGGGFVEAAEDVQQGGFAAAGRADDADALARADAQIEAVEHAYVEHAVVVAFADGLAVQHGLAGGGLFIAQCLRRFGFGGAPARV